jgi:hypothetical protein
VEPEATLVGAKSGVELDTVSTVDLDLNGISMWQLIRDFQRKVSPGLCRLPRQHGTE